MKVRTKQMYKYWVYNKAEFLSSHNAPVLGMFIKYEEAKRFGDAQDFPVVISFNWSGERNAKRDMPEDIEVITKKGTCIILKWNKREYRAYDTYGNDLHLGAAVPDGLIKHLQERM